MNKLWKKSVLYDVIEGVNTPLINLARAILNHGDTDKAMKELDEYNKKHRFKRGLYSLFTKQ